MFLLIFLFGPIALIAATETETSVPIVEINEYKKLNSVNEASIHLDLSGLGLRSINPNAFENCTITKTLDLSNNSIKGLPENVFAPLVNLEHLSLANNGIESSTNAFLGLNQLKSLNISNNPLKEVLEEPDFAGLTKSCGIFIGGSRRLRKLTPLAFGEMKNKSVISINDQPKNICPKAVQTMFFQLRKNLIALEKEIPSSIHVKACTEENRVKSVETFDGSTASVKSCRTAIRKYEGGIPRINFFESRIESFEKGWYQIQDPSFNTIEFVHNWISEITSELLNDLPENIKAVNLERNSIDRVRKNVIVNYHLQALDLLSNGLSVIEDDAFVNTNLTHLNLRSNSLTSLRFAMSLPTSMIHLNLESNNIEEIPADTFANLKNLIHINLEGNKIIELGAQSLKGLESLQVLSFSMNGLERIQPGAFHDLKSLRYLNLFLNNISRLDRGVFEGLGCLENLELSSNKLTTFTKENLEGLTGNLNTLSLGSNELAKLEADAFVNKPRTSLWLGFNKLQEIVEGTFDLPYLERLDLDNNNISRIEKGAARHLGDSSDSFHLHLSDNPIERLENGALAGMMDRAYVHLGDKLEIIEAGVFDDL